MTGLELREQDDGTLRFSGYAATTEQPYKVGWFVETIARGAFKRSLNNPKLDVKLLINHEGLPLADTLTRTLRLREDDHGLFTEADLDPRDPDVQSLASKMHRGLVREMSMGFRAPGQDWNEDRSRRRVTQVEMHRGDVSPVTFGANDTTSAALRSQVADDLPLEERNRRAAMLGDRLCVATSVVLRAADDACARCNGVGTVTIPCPTCTGERAARGAPAPIKRGAAEAALRARLEQHLRNGSPGRSTGRVAALSATELRLRVRAMQERERARRAR
jgi:HK97 family phage prohead protease